MCQYADKKSHVRTKSASEIVLARQLHACANVLTSADARFLRATAANAVARLGHWNSVCPSVRLFVTRVDQSKTVQARINKSLPSAAWKTLVSATVKLFYKFEEDHLERRR